MPSVGLKEILEVTRCRFDQLAVGPEYLMMSCSPPIGVTYPPSILESKLFLQTGHPSEGWEIGQYVESAKRVVLVHGKVGWEAATAVGADLLRSIAVRSRRERVDLCADLAWRILDGALTPFTDYAGLALEDSPRIVLQPAVFQRPWAEFLVSVLSAGVTGMPASSRWSVEEDKPTAFIEGVHDHFYTTPLRIAELCKAAIQALMSPFAQEQSEQSTDEKAPRGAVEPTQEQRNAGGFVIAPTDPSAYVSARYILAHYAGSLGATTAKKLKAILDSNKDKIRQWQPRSNRLSIHIGDWLKFTTEPAADATPSPEEIESRKAPFQKLKENRGE